MIQIKPILVGLPSKLATHLFVRPIINSTDDKYCDSYYELISEEKTTIKTVDSEGVETENVEVKQEILQKGNRRITEEEYTLWGSDNAYIEDLIINFLGIERCTQTFTE